VYVVCEGRLVGYAPLTDVRAATDEERNGQMPIAFIRQGGSVACTIPEPITGFRGWRYRWWDRDAELPPPPDHEEVLGGRKE
jgi:hypothetical protein